jgi:hypothetical protein
LVLRRRQDCKPDKPVPYNLPSRDSSVSSVSSSASKFSSIAFPEDTIAEYIPTQGADPSTFSLHSYTSPVCSKEDGCVPISDIPKDTLWAFLFDEPVDISVLVQQAHQKRIFPFHFCLIVIERLTDHTLSVADAYRATKAVAKGCNLL